MQIRCGDSKYIKNIFLEGYKLSFCAVSRSYGVANIVKKTGSKVPGGLWKISESDEKELDIYEGYPTLYTKDYFKLNNERVLFYIIKRNYIFKRPLREYVDIISQGYKDCDLDNEYLKRRLAHYSIEL
tara:strand:+ start:64 stop:447 length:384 start_codon:yes stop_codon:yes gene_type:complete